MNLAPQWFCVQTRSKQESRVSASLRALDRVEVYAPRLRYRKSTRRGPIWFCEAVFPGYVFARFCLHECLQGIRYANGVADVVHFGDQWPAIPEETVAALKSRVDGDEALVVETTLSPGEEVMILAGAFAGWEARVLSIHSASQRVRVLLDFMGRLTPVELPVQDVEAHLAPRELVFSGSVGA